MKKKIKSKLITGGIILAIIMIAFFAFYINNQENETNEEIARCIGKNSILYVQLGCHACETQEKMFGENYQYLNSIDCFYELNKCEGIEVTPTWKIKGEIYKGVQSIENLQKLTEC